MKKVFIIALTLLSLTLLAQKKNSYDKTVDKASDGIGTAYKDGKEGVSILYKDLKSVAPKISQGVQEVAKGLKVGAESVWVILVRQQLVWSICFLILTLSAIFNWCLFYIRTQIKTKHKDVTFVTLKRSVFIERPNPKWENYYDSKDGYEHDLRSHRTIKVAEGEEEYSCPQIIKENDISTSTIKEIFKYVHLAICISLSYFSFIHFADMLTGFINPEFGAIKTIMTIVQNLK